MNDATEAIRESKRFRGLDARGPFCFAPAFSLNFFTNGDMAPCCFQADKTYGRYPENSVKEVWAGILRRQLCDQMLNSPPTSCGQCTGSARDGNHEGVLARIYDQVGERHHEAVGTLQEGLPVPRVFHFELSSNCNLECIMCNDSKSSAIRKNRMMLPPLHSPYDDRFVDQIRPYLPGLFEAHFRGGEPFLARINYQIWDLLVELNPKIKTSISTNGTVLTDRAKVMIETLKPLINISIESLDQANYERIRKNARFKRLRANMDWLMERGHLSSLAVCPMKMNWQDIPELYFFCNRNRVAFIVNTVFEPIELSLMDLPAAELGKIIRFLEQATLDDRSPPIDYNLATYRGFLSQLRAWHVKKSGSFKSVVEAQPSL
jgi:sulfatase maturation enzyme AslB (radical SAM superfamily)